MLHIFALSLTLLAKKSTCIEENNVTQIRLLLLFYTQSLSVCQVDHSSAIFFTMLSVKDKTM